VSRRFVVALLVALAACHTERASVEELYATRMLGLGYLQRNQLAEAESAFTKLSKLAPDDPFGYANLGVTYLQSGRLAEAEKQLRQAQKLDPSNTDVSLMLAKIYALTNRPNDARATLENLRQDTTNNPRVLYAIADLDAAKPVTAGKYEQDLRSLLGVTPANLAVRLRLVEAAGATRRRRQRCSTSGGGAAHSS
jgi:Flp pilus assembly protein TadD, contains TPR repeats